MPSTLSPIELIITLGFAGISFLGWIYGEAVMKKLSQAEAAREVFQTTVAREVAEMRAILHSFEVRCEQRLTKVETRLDMLANKVGL